MLGAAVAAWPFAHVLNDRTQLPIKWPAGSIRIRLLLGDTTNLSDGSSFNQSARTAAQAWNAVMGSAQFATETATGTPSESNGINELAFAAQVYGRDFGENVLAVTTGYSFSNQRAEADIIFNSARSWDSYRGTRPVTLPAGTIDLQRVALHELGHVLGLDHPDEAEPAQSVAAIMNSTISSRFELSTDDIEAVQSLYGPPGVPANDNFANASLLSLGGSQSLSVKGYNTNATKETGDPRQGDNPGGRSVWWRWTAPSAGSVTLDTRGSYFDSTLGVYTGATLTALTKVADNDDIDPGVRQNSTLTFNATAGTEYRIDVDGYNSIEQDSSDTTGADSAGITLNLAFTGSLGTAPTISTQPASQTVNSGASASFSVVAAGTAPLAYQWHFNNTAIAGATSSSHTVSSASSSSAGNYHVVVSNQAGSITSNTATLTVNTVTTPPPSSGGGGGGGGGAPSAWFCAVLAAIGLARFLARRAA